MGTVSFEDERMKDEVEEESDAVFFSPQAMWQMAEEYQDVKTVLYSDATEEEKKAAVYTLEQLWDMGLRSGGTPAGQVLAGWPRRPAG